MEPGGEPVPELVGRRVDPDVVQIDGRQPRDPLWRVGGAVGAEEHVAAGGESVPFEGLEGGPVERHDPFLVTLPEQAEGAFGVQDVVPLEARDLTAAESG